MAREKSLFVRRGEKRAQITGENEEKILTLLEQLRRHTIKVNFEKHQKQITQCVAEELQ